MTDTGSKAIPSLETKRLILRPFDPGHAPEVQRLVSDRAIAEMTVNIPHLYKDGMAEEWISWHKNEFISGHGVTFAIVSRKESCLIGAIALRKISKGGQATLGYWIGKPYWNRGFCTEAGRAVLEYAFTELGVLRIEASHLRRNPASGRVMRKLGMRREGTERRFIEKWARNEDFELYALSKSEWMGQRGIVPAKA
jgi:ribosomal-protein-alanine N-acetyltransferase